MERGVCVFGKRRCGVAEKKSLSLIILYQIVGLGIKKAAFIGGFSSALV